MKTQIAKDNVSNTNSESLSKEINDVEKGLKNFESLLTSLDSIEDKKKALWKEIYTNAVVDRYNAYILFHQLLNIVKDDAAQHAIHGATLNKYIERMNKSTDQLIRLAELVADAQSQSETPIDSDYIYNQIAKQK